MFKMKTYKVSAYGIKFTIVQQQFLPPKGFSAMNLFGFIWTREKNITENTLRHEAIHTLQARSLLYVGHYLLYGVEFAVKFAICLFGGQKGQGGLMKRVKEANDRAYYSVSLEQEAYFNSRNLNYRAERKRFAFAKYIFKWYPNS